MSATSRRIPVVNLSHYRAGTPGERARFVQAFGDGLREFGFVTVEGHGVEDGLIRRTCSDVERLFALPERVKARYSEAERGGQRAEDTVRYSLPFFVHPYADCVLQPPPCTQTPDNPARHAPITADAFLKQRLREIGLLK